MTFTSGEDLRLDANFENELSVMLTTGYDYRFRNNWSLSGEIGAIMIGGVDLRASSNVPEVQDALDADADVQSTIRDAEDLNLYPYISIMASYRF